VTVRRVRGLSDALATIALVGVAIAAVALAATHPGAGSALVALLAIATLVVVVIPPRVERGALGVESDRLTLDGRALLRRDAIAAVLPGERESAGVLRVVPRRGRALDLDVGTPTAAAALVDALGWGAGESRLSVPLWRAPWRDRTAALATFAVVGGAAAALLALSVLLHGRVPWLVFFFFAWPSWQPGWRAEIDAEGMTVTWLGRVRRVVPWSEVARVEPAGARLLVHLRGGESFVLALVPGSTVPRWIAAIAARASCYEERAAR
jgi:hypothetical protein